jgi:hypothetical protein
METPESIVIDELWRISREVVRGQSTVCREAVQCLVITKVRKVRINQREERPREEMLREY